MSYSKAIFRISLTGGNDAARSALTGVNFTNSGGVVSGYKSGHNLLDGAVVTVPAGTYAGDWLVKKTDADNFTLHTNHAIGIITVSGAPAVNDTFIVGSQTFTFKASRSGAGEVTIGADVYDTGENIAFAINTDIGGTTANYMAFVGDVAQPFTEGIERVAVYYMQPGTVGNAITFTENAANISVDGAGTLTGGANSTYSADRSAVSITPFGGQSWGDGFKTLRLSGNGNINVVAKSSDATNSGVNASWTNLSSSVTLSSGGQTAIIDNAAGSSWTCSANVTGGSEGTSHVIGTSAQTFVIADAFTTGKIAYKALASQQDFSAFQQVSFMFTAWVGAFASGVYKICLCSDASGDTIVNELVLPYTYSSAYHPSGIVIDNGGALGNNINSVAIYAISDPGARTIVINNIIACLAPTATNCITHKTLIGKNNDKWYPIRSISGVNLKIDADTYVSFKDTCYYGVTETIALYLRQCVYITQYQLTTSGTANLFQMLDGGWDSANNVQNGNTWTWGTQYLFYNYNKNYNIFQRLSYNGSGTMYIQSSTGQILKKCNITYGTFSVLGSNSVVLLKCTVLNNTTTAISTGAYNSNMLLLNCVFENIYGSILGQLYFDTKIKNCTISNSASAGLTTTFLKSIVGLVNNCTIESDYFIGGNYPSLDYQMVKDNDGIVGNHWIYSYYASINIQNATKGGSGKEWKTIITNSYRNIIAPVEFRLALIAVKASKLVTVTIYCTKDHATNIAACLVAKAQPGVLNAETCAPKANNTNREQLTLTFTPSAAGVVEIVGRTYYVAGNSNSYFDTISITQAD